MLSRSVSVATPKIQQRAVSAERRRQGATTPSNAERMLVTSMRSLSVSFQGESYSLPVSKVKPPPAAAGTPGSLRKGTPERKKAGVTPVRDRRERDRENSRPSDHQQHRWPGRLRGENSSFFTRSLDYGTGRVKLSGSGSALKELRKSVADENSRNKVSNDLKLENHDVDVRGTSELNGRPRLGESRNSDSESVSSESTAGGNVIQLRGGPRGVVVPGRFSQDASNRVHKVLDPGSPLSSVASNRTLGHSKLIVAKKFQNDSPVSSPREVFASRGLSPLRGGMKAASPSKALTSSGALLRGMASPTRARSGLGTSMNDSNMCSTPSMLTFAVDMRKGKLGENRIADAHDLRLLYNRLLQWRLANAKLENTLLVQEQTAQEPHLESWGLFERDHCNSLSGAIEALEASTIRLPLVGGARADIDKVQEAIFSAVDMMQAMASSVCSLLTKPWHKACHFLKMVLDFAMAMERHAFLQGAEARLKRRKKTRQSPFFSKDWASPSSNDAVVVEGGYRGEVCFVTAAACWDFGGGGCAKLGFQKMRRTRVSYKEKGKKKRK
ncbi:UNVERIFIED_CONTAM: QWRF motif-containing protein 2 [Sesamum calycinum]|uniref:QWRF motif-containing protein 2 n=1 Tax=Sesamum calycinum TaxID=2727403 RepID=A0AAW2P7K9_9LAMI